MIKIKKSSIIYLACPPAVATGGPLALHQLAYKLKLKGYNVFMYYYRDNKPDPIHENYKAYDIPYVYKINDHKENLLIVPELKTELLYAFKNIRGAIWWLSIDNYYRLPLLYKIFGLFGISKLDVHTAHAVSNYKINLFKKKSFSFKDVDKFYHLTQSKYALDYINSKLKRRKNNVAMLTDYLLPTFLEPPSEIIEKEDIILYNPLKGKSFTQKLIQQNKNLTWVPIENMTPLEVKNLLCKSKVYVDFGEHPGRDRFPREAAISGCCIVTGKRGSAFYNEDVPIDAEFKFEESAANIPVIIKKLEEIINNYDAASKKFGEYRSFIMKNEAEFEAEINDAFEKVEK